MTKPKRVTLFIQCIIDGVYPNVGEDMVKVLRKLGVSLECPVDQTCCGQPAFNNGYRKEAREAARHFIEIFEHAETIVCPSGSCVAMVRKHYPELFEDDPSWLKRAEVIAERTFEFSEYLVDILGVTDVDAAYDGVVTYHDSCHLLRTLGIREQPRKLINHVKDLTFVEMNESDLCCGFGGSFSVKYPDISTAMVDEKIKHIFDSRADTVVGCDMGCLMNIQGRLSRIGSPVKTMHIAQLLAGSQD